MSHELQIVVAASVAFVAGVFLSRLHAHRQQDAFERSFQMPKGCTHPCGPIQLAIQSVSQWKRPYSFVDGNVEAGEVRVGDVVFARMIRYRPVLIAGISTDGKIVEKVTADDVARLLIRGAALAEIQPGDQIVFPAP